jgi:hypothetical protein
LVFLLPTDTIFLQARIWGKTNISSVGVHPQLSYNGLPINGALVVVGSLWPLSFSVGGSLPKEFFYIAISGIIQ